MIQKIVALCLVVSQLGLVSVQANDRTVHPELSLLETVITLKGLGLSQQEMNVQLQGAVEHYDRTAPRAGRDERLQSALVGLNLLTPQQARRFGAETQVAQAELIARGQATDAAAFQAQIEQLSRLSLDVAQFSACRLGTGLIVAGAITAIIGAALYSDNPTCHPDYSRPYTCYRDNCYGVGADRECYPGYETCYHTVCDVPGYYPDRQAGTITLIAGGVGIAAGVLLVVLDRDGC